jgi:hypothetical protein
MIGLTGITPALFRLSIWYLRAASVISPSDVRDVPDVRTEPAN